MRVQPSYRKAFWMGPMLACLLLAGDAATLRLEVSTPAWAGTAMEPQDGSAILSPRLQAAVSGSDPDALVPVIVTTTRPLSVESEGRLRSLGGALRRRFARLDGFAANVPVRALRDLSGLAGAGRISFDSEVRVANDLNYVTVGAGAVGGSSGVSGSGLDGSGVTVAVVDSGIANHPDLSGRILGEVEIVGREKGFADYFGHGTHVAGIIAGDGRSSSDSKSFRRLNGIAPKAKLLSVRVLGADGSGRVSDVLAGIDWVLQHREEFGIRVLNLSLGHPVEESYRTDPLCLALERAWAAGIVVVVSAGNAGRDGYATINSPGNHPALITVGASNNAGTSERADDLLASYSSRGPSYLDHVVKPDLVAPGNRTVSLRAAGSTLDAAFPDLRVKVGEFRNDPARAGDDSVYFRLSGSSMAAGVVSGMAALMIQADPAITPDTVKARLMKSAEKRLELDIFSAGSGFADLRAALALFDRASAPTLSPIATWTEQGILLESTGDLWQDAAVWGDESIWGLDPLRGSGTVWGDTVVWGGEMGDRDGGVHGDTVVWGGEAKGKNSGSETTVESSTVVWGGE
jgi:serine protease AprX